MWLSRWQKVVLWLSAGIWKVAPVKPVGFGVIGAGSFVANAAVLPVLIASDRTEPVSACSLGSEPDPAWSDIAVDSYEKVLADPGVEAIYIPLPNHLHLEWIQRCAEAGKHVLCEKPLTLNAAEARTAVKACQGSGVLLAEAWMTPFHRRWRAMMAHASSGQLGSPTGVTSTFSFTIGPGDQDNYRFDSEMGGGALLDVGVYCLGPAVHLWGANPVAVEVTDRECRNGVDLTTEFRLTWAGGQVAVGRCSFSEPEEQSILIECERGVVGANVGTHTGGANAESFHWSRTAPEGTQEERTVEVPANDPYRAMVDRFADAVRGNREWPRPIERSVEMLGLVDRIREAGR